MATKITSEINTKQVNTRSKYKRRRRGVTVCL
jgi:hypothetical protein